MGGAGCPGPRGNLLREEVAPALPASGRAALRRSVNEAQDRTLLFRAADVEHARAGQILRTVYEALQEKGYDPVSQIVGYLLSGDPTYITSHRQARSLIRTVERDVLLEVLVRHYLASIS